MTRRSGAGADRSRRALDIALVVPGLVVALPVLAVVAVAVRISMGSPVLFRQQRAGRDGVPFTLVKFRTMAVRGDDAFDPSDDAARLSPAGTRLRSTSLDELPQLWNVLRGDMALVGPRPLPTAYRDRYTPAQRQRLLVRPGMTGLAQISGRNDLSWEDKFRIDADYVSRRSVVLDLRILWRTLRTVLRRAGVAAPGEATSSEFLGLRAAR